MRSRGQETMSMKFPYFLNLIAQSKNVFFFSGRICVCVESEI